MSAILGGVYQYGKAPITRHDGRDLTVRLTELTAKGLTIEADMLSNGRGNVVIETGVRAERVLIHVGPSTEGPLTERVNLLINGRYLSVAAIMALAASQAATASESAPGPTNEALA